MKVRILLDGLTHGGMVHRKGSVVDADSRMTQFADGETLLGQVVAEWAEDEMETVKPVKNQVTTINIDIKSAQETPFSVEAVKEAQESLAAITEEADKAAEALEAVAEESAPEPDDPETLALLDAIRKGDPKGAIIKSLGQSEEFTQRGLLAKWADLQEAGRIVEGERAGKWTVAE